MISEVGGDLLLTRITRPHKAVAVGISHRLRQRPPGDPQIYSGQGGRRRDLPPLRSGASHRWRGPEFWRPAHGDEHQAQVSLGLDNRSIEALERRPCQSQGRELRHRRQWRDCGEDRPGAEEAPGASEEPGSEAPVPAWIKSRTNDCQYGDTLPHYPKFTKFLHYHYHYFYKIY